MNAEIWHPLLLCTSFLSLLVSIDRELAESCRYGRCPFCGGHLDAGFYRRKIRIGETAEDFGLCFNFCCRQADCRRRTMPRSVRFCGRSPFPWMVVALAELFSKGAPKKRVSVICQQLSVSERTVRSWLRRWRGISSTGWWRERLGRDLPEWKGSSLVRLAMFVIARDDAAAPDSFRAILDELSFLRFRFSRCVARE